MCQVGFFARQLGIECKQVQQYIFYKMAETEPAWKLIYGETIVDIAGEVIELPVVITATVADEDVMIVEMTLDVTINRKFRVLLRLQSDQVKEEFSYQILPVYLSS